MMVCALPAERAGGGYINLDGWTDGRGQTVHPPPHLTIPKRGRGGGLLTHFTWIQGDPEALRVGEGSVFSSALRNAMVVLYVCKSEHT